jgi:hypothetical protein
VNSAKDIVDELRITSASATHVIESEEITRETIDDLLGFRKKLLARFVACALAATSTSAARVLRHDSL